jgi:hypothetical protein
VAYLKVAEGCDYRCAFCIIPHLRGDQRSRPIESIVAEANSLAAQGRVYDAAVSRHCTDFTALTLHTRNCSEVAIYRPFVNQGPHQGPLLQGITDTHLLVRRAQRFNKIIVYGCMHERSTNSCTPLPRCPHCTKENTPHNEVHICIGKNDNRVVSTKFKDRAPHAPGYSLCDRPPHSAPIAKLVRSPSPGLNRSRAVRNPVTLQIEFHESCEAAVQANLSNLGDRRTRGSS